MKIRTVMIIMIAAAIAVQIAMVVGTARAQSTCTFVGTYRPECQTEVRLQDIERRQQQMQRQMDDDRERAFYESLPPTDFGKR